MKIPPLDLRSGRPFLALMGVSAVLLLAGLVGIFTALGNNVKLPDQGTIQSIIQAAAPTQTPAPGAAEAAPTPRGPAPVRMLIPRLYADAPVVTLGLGPDTYPEVPERPDQVAWYDFSATPGVGSNAVFSGHVDWQTRTHQPIPGVFYRLRELQIGDEIKVVLEDGAELRYRVSGNVATKYDDPNVLKAMQPTNKDVITLITCGGTWLSDRREANGGNYSHRIIVRAERVAD